MLFSTVILKASQLHRVRTWKVGPAGIRRVELRVRPRGERPARTTSIPEDCSLFSPLGDCGASDSRPIEFPLAGAALGLAMLATLSHVAVLGTFSLVLSCLVFSPSFVSAWRTLRKDYRIDNNVLTAARLVVFASMNFFFVAALDATFRSLAGSLHRRARTRYESRVLRLKKAYEVNRFKANLEGILHEAEFLRLTQVPLEKSPEDLRAARSADRMAPFMMGAFLFSLPVYGANLAASFLLTSFGAHVRTLSPTLLREELAQAIDRGILIRNTEVFQVLAETPALVVDLRIVEDSQMVAELINLLSLKSAGKLGSFGAVYFLAPKVEAEAGGLLVDLVGEHLLPVSDEVALEDRLEQVIEQHGNAVLLSGGGRSPILCGGRLVNITVADLAKIGAADVVIGSDLVFGLEYLIRLSNRYAQKSRFNWSGPLVCDLLDISTTVFIHFGVFYSTLFNYAGLLSGIINSGRKNCWKLSYSNRTVADRKSVIDMGNAEGAIPVLAKSDMTLQASD